MRIASRIAVSSSTTRTRYGIASTSVHESGQSYASCRVVELQSCRGERGILLCNSATLQLDNSAYNPPRMQVAIEREPKLSKADHLFVLLAEGTKPDLALGGKALRKSIDDAKFGGRADESITILSGEPRKTTLVGLGKDDGLTIRGVRTALLRVAKIAKAQRDHAIVVVFPYVIPKLDAAQTTRLVADSLAQADYKYDQYITVKKEDKQPKISA